MMTEMYREKLNSLIKFGIIGVICGVLFGLYFALDSNADIITALQAIICFALILTGFPYGVVKVYNVLRGIIPLNLYTSLMYLLVIIVAAYLVGVFVYPIVLIYTIIQYIRYKKKEEQFSVDYTV